MNSNMIQLRSPVDTDGYALHQLVAACPPLDTNSMYCNLLQATHFADTSVVAELDGELVGFITGHIPPKKPDVLFVWQVAAASKARGTGLTDRMLHNLIERNPQVTLMETTVTPDNTASAKMFQRFADSLGASISRQVLFSKDKHFQGEHDDEVLLTIGPFSKQ